MSPTWISDLETMIRNRLGARFPDDALTGEEYGASGGKGPRRWSIDPIDGTGNLVHGLPLWAISIGLIVAGEPMLGVIVDPTARRAFLGGQRGRRLARRPEASRTRRRDFSRSRQRLRLDQCPPRRRSALASRPASRPGKCLLRTIVRRIQSPSGLDLARRARARHRRRNRHHERGRLPSSATWPASD